MSGLYETPKLTAFGSVTSLTLGATGSDADGVSGLVGNMSMSDDGMGNDNNAGG
jgi:hypothetical protein